MATKTKSWNEEVREAATATNATLEFSSNPIINQKVKEATIGLQKYVYKRFVDFPTDNDKRLLADFILAAMREQSMNKPSTKKSAIIALSYLLKHFNYTKSFTEITSQDLISFLDTLSKVKEKDEFGKVVRVTDQFRDHSIDPNQKWIRTSNTYASSISKFYRWVHRPDLSNKDRRKLKGDQLPEVLKGVTNMWVIKNEKYTAVEPGDLWYPEDDVIFLKYCKHNPRLRFYHALAIETGARPIELLQLKIKDIKIEKGSRGELYSRLRVGRFGKMEESRPVPMHQSIKYYRAYLSTKHPEGANPNPDAYIFASTEHSALGKASTLISENALYQDYKNYKKRYYLDFSSK